jgi:hypothetical protein
MMFLNAVKATGGDTSPDALKKAMSTMTMDTPNGSVTMSKYGSVYIGTGDLFICKTALVDGNYRWQPVYTFDQVLFKNPW